MSFAGRKGCRGQLREKSRRERNEVTGKKCKVELRTTVGNSHGQKLECWSEITSQDMRVWQECGPLHVWWLGQQEQADLSAAFSQGTAGLV